MSLSETKLSRRLVTDVGHIILQVGDMDKALRLYVDTLGFELASERSKSTVWKIVRTKGGELTLYKPEKITPLVLRDIEDTPITLHVDNFQEAASRLIEAGYKVEQITENNGNLIDPWGNIIGLHDHRKG